VADNLEVRQAEIERVRVAADDMAKLMNGRFELDQTKLQAFATGQAKERWPHGSDGTLGPPT
jgi:hypothetical protein